MAHKDPEKHRQASRDWYAKNRERARAGVKRWADANKARRAWLNSRRVAQKSGHVGISMDFEDFKVWYREAIQRANGICEWCHDPLGKRGPTIDHDHESGIVRAVVCYSCNIIEGHAKNANHLEKIAIALRKYEKSKEMIDASSALR